MHKFLTIFLLSILPAVSCAGTIDVLPSIVKLKASQTASSIQFRNTTNDEASFEIKVVEESGVGTEMQRIPSSDVVVSPKIFTVKPGAHQTVRFSLKKPNTTADEKRYRLFAEQLPTNVASDEPGIRMLVNLGIPLFISPVNEQIGLARTITNKGISIQNTGNVTVQVLGFEAPGCENVRFNRYLRPTVTIDIPLAEQQGKNCAYQARLESGLYFFQ